MNGLTRHESDKNEALVQSNEYNDDSDKTPACCSRSVRLSLTRTSVGQAWRGISGFVENHGQSALYMIT